jgi:hypothetical protein
MAKKSTIKVWTRFDGEPGVEYEESGGYVSIRVWKDDGYQQAGPIRLLGSPENTIRQLLKEMRT